MPNSVTLKRPFAVVSERIASSTGTAQTTAAARSGRWVSTAPISSPPFEPPMIASLSRVVTPVSTRWSAQAMKSSKQFCLVCSRPPWCHATPYSPPPRMLAIAKTCPCSSHCSRAGENDGFIEIA